MRVVHKQVQQKNKLRVNGIKSKSHRLFKAMKKKKIEMIQTTLIVNVKETST